MAQINKPTDYFDISTWTATTSAISNLNFSPDWVWIKSTDSGNSHILFDTIRGANERISSASNIAESTRTDELMSFDSNGYTLGSSGNTNDTNPFNASYVGWSWRGSDSSAASNTDGSITSTVSVNTTAGFSIVSWTGTGANATVGHGLGVAPKMVIIKNRSDAYDWIIYNQNIGNTGFLRLNTTAAYDTGINMFQNTDSTSSVFSISSHGAVNTSGNNFIAYCFAEKKGFSKFGSYTGNGSTDGTFIYTGFKPAFVMVKSSSLAGEDWNIIDNKRDPFNNGYHQLVANSNNAENTTDTSRNNFYSNGFKLGTTNSAYNGSGVTYIYMAFAENPLVGTNNIPATAR